MSLAKQMEEQSLKFFNAGKKRQKELGKEMVRTLKKVISKKGTPNRRSKPGEPPRKQSGKLYASVVMSAANGVLKVFTNNRYSNYLEEGTRFMAARPWFWKTIKLVLEAWKAAGK